MSDLRIRVCCFNSNWEMRWKTTGMFLCFLWPKERERDNMFHEIIVKHALEHKFLKFSVEDARVIVSIAFSFLAVVNLQIFGGKIWSYEFPQVGKTGLQRPAKESKLVCAIQKGVKKLRSSNWKRNRLLREWTTGKRKRKGETRPMWAQDVEEWMELNIRLAMRGMNGWKQLATNSQF